jgi:NitT/TauT family transport system ATP-binding protein
MITPPVPVPASNPDGALAPMPPVAVETPVPAKVARPIPSNAFYNEANRDLPELVRFENVTKTFGSGKDSMTALADVSFVVHDLPNVGELVAIVGPSGCGKSTLLRMIAGLAPHYPPSSGDVLIHGNVITSPSAERGMVDQKYSLLPHLTVVDNIAFGLELRGERASARRALAREWVAKVGLEGSEDKYPHQLSGGMQQRVSIASTLILKPKVLLMDEPFGALDPKVRMQMQWLLVKLWEEQQSTIFIVTHSVEEAVYLGDRVLRMSSKPGRVVESLWLPRPTESPQEMRRRPWFSRVVADLQNRLEIDAPVTGPLPHAEQWSTFSS